MATVYKIDIEAVSHWISFPEEELKEIIEDKINEVMEEKFYGAEFEVTEIKVEKTA
jgi:hypothetical protein